MPTDTYTGTIAASEQVTSLMRRINALEASVSSAFGTYVLEFGSSNSPRGVVVSGLTVFFNCATQDEVYKYTTSGTLVSNSSLSILFAPISSVGIAFDGTSIYAISDSNTKGIWKLNSDLTLNTSWAVGTIGDTPRGLAYSGGYLYVVNKTTSQINKYDTVGTLITSWGTTGVGAGEFQNPVGVSVNGAGTEVYVSDITRDKIIVFNTSGTYQREFGTSGSGSGQFAQPTGIAFDSSGRIFVCDPSRKKVLQFNSSEVFVSEFGTTGTSAGEFQGPEYISIDGSNQLYVSDPSRGKVIKFSGAGGGIAQTTFNSYTTTAATSLGTPDGGVAVPSLNALNANGAGPVPNHILDMRTAIETLAPYFTNAGTGNPFNWTAASADNLYFVAMGDRTAYGATGGAAYDWTRDEAGMINTPAYGLDIGEIKECVATLEAS